MSLDTSAGAIADIKKLDAPFLGARLHQITQVYDEQLSEVLGDLTVRQLQLLAAIDAHAGGSQTALVERTGIDRSTLADIVRRMQRKGLLQRRRTKEDARAYAVKLTADGVRLLEKGLAIARKLDTEADEEIRKALKKAVA